MEQDGGRSAGLSTSSEDATVTKNPTTFTQVKITDWLVVGASQPIGNARLYVSGDARIDGKVLAQTLDFTVNGVPSTAEITAANEAAGQLGLTGVLRVQNAVGIATDPEE